MPGEPEARWELGIWGRGGREHRSRLCHRYLACGDFYSYPYANTHQDPNPDTDTHQDAYEDSYSYQYAYEDAHAHQYAHAHDDTLLEGGRLG